MQFCRCSKPFNTFAAQNLAAHSQDYDDEYAPYVQATCMELYNKRILSFAYLSQVHFSPTFAIHKDTFKIKVCRF